MIPFNIKGKGRNIKLNEFNDDLKYKTGWFACKVTSGYEMKVANELKKLTQDPKWGQYVFDVFVPTRKVIKKDKEKLEVIIKENIYVKMILTQDVYSAIKIDGFRTPLPPKDPTPIPEEKMLPLFRFRNE